MKLVTVGVVDLPLPALLSVVMEARKTMLDTADVYTEYPSEKVYHRFMTSRDFYRMMLDTFEDALAYWRADDEDYILG
jgi:predicted oxidoreductase